MDVIDGVIAALTSALEARDQGTHYHGQRVLTLTLELGDMAGLGGEELRVLGLGAVLHDIGKIGIPDQILLKPGTLTSDERTVMWSHTQIGSHIVAKLPMAANDRIARIVLHHHENLDGSGYPDGLAGEAIPLEAQIIRICDSFDAITSRRSYKTRSSVETALTELRDDAGTIFNPDLVELFEGLPSLRAVPETTAARNGHGNGSSKLGLLVANLVRRPPECP